MAIYKPIHYQRYHEHPVKVNLVTFE